MFDGRFMVGMVDRRSLLRHARDVNPKKTGPIKLDHSVQVKRDSDPNKFTTQCRHRHVRR